MLTLTYRADHKIPVEAEVIAPDHLLGKSSADIAKLSVQHGNAQAALGEFFDVSGDASDAEIRIDGDCSRVKWIGAGMTMGRIRIHGNIGMHLGSEMKGGLIEVDGDAADWVGAEMRGGRIHIRGNAGHLVGAGYRGSRLGMRGGAILVEGKAGSEIASTMRRGLVAIGGETGDFPGVGLIAGSVFLFGTPGLRTAAGMKRGTIALCGVETSLLPTFRFDCVYRPTFLHLYLRQLAAWNFGPALKFEPGLVRRYRGDLVALGKGEVLML
ncbi:MAG: formylmethanofuran dehydrogenase subunit C [Gemmataceae bacterium]|nr:formylmethanofuran dehydrogenase subunit C [Gemmataceae bacterium]